MAGFRGLLKRFGASREGHAGVMFSVLAFPMVIAVGFTIDFTQASKHRSDLQNIADAVALTAVRSLPISAGAATNDGTNYYEVAIQNIRAGLLTDGLTISYEYDPHFKAIAEITATAKGAFGNTIGLGTVRYEMRADAVLERTNTEVAMVLDMSGSMETAKMRALGNSVETFQTTLDAVLGSGVNRFKVSVVPFSRSVSMPDYAVDWLQNQSDKDLAIAADEVCFAPQNQTADSRSNVSVLGTFALHNEFAWGCLDEKMFPLTDDRTKLSQLVSDLKTPAPWRVSWRNSQNTGYWGTALYMGSVWAMRTLDPAFGSAWPAESNPAAVNDARKFVIIMTDGEQLYVDPYSRNQADNIQRDVCDNMKDLGITVYAIAFRAPAAAKNLLKGCASSDDHFVDATNESALQASYELIAKKIGEPYPRLVF